jgi:hypothetical protein
MPISDYANAFFFARRTRVTLKSCSAPDCSGDLFENASFSVHAALSLFRKSTGFRCPSQSVKARKNFCPRKIPHEKQKARHRRAFAVLGFRLAYFASLAI